MKLNLSDNIKGILYFAGGTIGFFYTVGWFRETLHYLVLAGSIASMIYGFIVADFWDKLNKLVNQFKNNNSSGKK